MTDFRALCEELIQQLQELHTMVWGEAPHLLDEDSGGSAYLDLDIEDVLDRARAALAEQPVGPTDEEIMELMPQQMRDDLANAARALAGFDRANVKAAGAMRIILNRQAVNHSRAVLARWGSYPTPIPVVERLPGPEDCDAEGQCWAWNAGSCGWWEWVDSKMIPYSHDDFTHWLPANALPVPPQ